MCVCVWGGGGMNFPLKSMRFCIEAEGGFAITKSYDFFSGHTRNEFRYWWKVFGKISF